jgi:hypothetical protein
MKRYLNKLASFIVISMIPTIAFADEASKKAPESFPVILLVFMAMFIAWIFYIGIARRAEVKRNLKYMAKAAVEMEQTIIQRKRRCDHMDIIESRSKEIVELLKSIDRKLSETGD